MSNPSNLGAVLYADEASFGDTSVTTFDERLPVANSVTDMVAGLEQSKINVDQTVQYQNDGRHEVRGPYAGSFTIELFLTGHGSTTVGAISATSLATFLGRCVGNSTATQNGGTVNTPTDADTFTHSSATIADGSLIRLGALGDGDGEGQFLAVSTESGGTVELLTAADGAPLNGAVIYAPELIFPNEGPTAAAVTSMRFQLITANGAWNCWGCYCSALEFTGLNAGEVPRVRATIQVSNWTAKNNPTFPTATAVESFIPGVVAGGSLFRQVVGTTTRNKDTIRDFSLNIDLQTVPLMGPGSGDARQIVIGVRRVKCQASFGYTVDAEAAGTDTLGDVWNTDELSVNYYHILNSLVVENGRAVGIYFPKCKLVGMRPTQMDMDGINRKRVEWMALTGPTTDTALEQSNWRLGLA